MRVQVRRWEKVTRSLSLSLSLSDRKRTGPCARCEHPPVHTHNQERKHMRDTPTPQLCASPRPPHTSLGGEPLAKIRDSCRRRVLSGGLFVSGSSACNTPSTAPQPLLQPPRSHTTTRASTAQRGWERTRVRRRRRVAGLAEGDTCVCARGAGVVGVCGVLLVSYRPLATAPISTPDIGRT